MRPRGPLDAVTGVVEDAAGALRRRRESRRPYVKLFDEAGGVRGLDTESEPGRALIETASAMVDAAVPGPGDKRSEVG